MKELGKSSLNLLMQSRQFYHFNFKICNLVKLVIRHRQQNLFFTKNMIFKKVFFWKFFLHHIYIYAKLVKYKLQV